MTEDKEKAVEKEQGIEILPGEHDELEASEMENISGGTPADYFLNLNGIKGESSDSLH
jgi:hypothetical protein